MTPEEKAKKETEDKAKAGKGVSAEEAFKLLSDPAFLTAAKAQLISSGEVQEKSAPAPKTLEAPKKPELYTPSKDDEPADIIAGLQENQKKMDAFHEANREYDNAKRTQESEAKNNEDLTARVREFASDPERKKLLTANPEMFQDFKDLIMAGKSIPAAYEKAKKANITEEPKDKDKDKDKDKEKPDPISEPKEGAEDTKPKIEKKEETTRDVGKRIMDKMIEDDPSIEKFMDT